MDADTLKVVLGVVASAGSFLFRELLKAKDDRLKECQAKIMVLESEAREAVKAKNVELMERQKTLEADIRDKEAKIASLLGRSS